MRWFLLPAARRAALSLCLALAGTPAFAQQDDFGSSVQGVQAAAEFMGRIGQLKYPPKSWKDIVTPSIVNSPSS